MVESVVTKKTVSIKRTGVTGEQCECHIYWKGKHNFFQSNGTRWVQYIKPLHIYTESKRLEFQTTFWAHAWNHQAGNLRSKTMQSHKVLSVLQCAAEYNVPRCRVKIMVYDKWTVFTAQVELIHSLTCLCAALSLSHIIYALLAQAFLKCTNIY